jgi:hypothetical protein
MSHTGRRKGDTSLETSINAMRMSRRRSPWPSKLQPVFGVVAGWENPGYS